VNLKATFGSLNCPYSCFGSVISLPESAYSSCSANQPGWAVSSTLLLSSTGSSETRTVPDGTSATIPSFGRVSPVGLS